MTALAAVESTQLAECEQTIQRGLSTFIEVGSALLTIRDQRLYRVHYATFEAYCEQRWSLSRGRAYQLINAAEMSTTVDITSERQARELSGLDGDTAREVFTAATEATDGKPTAAAIREAREQIAPRPVAKRTETNKTEYGVDLATGEVTEAPAPPPTPSRTPSAQPVPEQRERDARAREAEASRNAYTQSLTRAVNFLAELGIHPQDAATHVEKYDPASPYATSYRLPVTPDLLRQAAGYLNHLADAWEARS